MLIAVASFKSGGCTTFAAALAAVWPGEPAVVVEADPAGGDLGGWHFMPDSPGLASLAAACRNGQPVDISAHTAHLPFGVEAVLAAAGRPQASSAIGVLAEAEISLWAKERTVVADTGRLDPGSPSLPLLRAADQVLIVARADVLSLLRVSLAEIPVDRAQLVIVGPPAETREAIAAHTGMHVGVEAPWDRPSAEVIGGLRHAGRAWTRVGLPATARLFARSIAPAQVPGGGGDQS